MDIQILNRDLSTYGVIADFISCEFTQAFNTRGSFKIVVNNNSEAAKYLIHDKFVYIDATRIGYIDVVGADEEGNTSGEIKTVEGCELKDRLDRLIYPAAGNVPDSYVNSKTETIIKTLIKKNAGIDAASARKISKLIPKEPDEQRGSSINYSAWNQDLITEAYNLLNNDNMGLTCTIDFDNDNIVYDVYEGQDLTVSDDQAGVILDVDMNTALSTSDVDDRSALKNLSVTAGAGEAEDREVYEVGTTATGYDRREVYTEARNALTKDEIKNAGYLKIAELKKARSVSCKYNPDGKYTLNEDFKLGDKISARTAIGKYNTTVAKIKTKYNSTSNAPEIDLILGFDISDVAKKSEMARRMDMDALKAAGVGGNVVADVTLDADADTITIDNVDIEKDGGVYDITINGQSTKPAYILLQIKDEDDDDYIADTNAIVQRDWQQGAFTASGIPTQSLKVEFEAARMFIVYYGKLLADISLSLFAGNASALGRSQSIKSGGQRLCHSSWAINGQAIGNINSIKLVNSGNDSKFKEGTRVIVRRKGV